MSEARVVHSPSEPRAERKEIRIHFKVVTMAWRFFEIWGFAVVIFAVSIFFFFFSLPALFMFWECGETNLPWPTLGLYLCHSSLKSAGLYLIIPNGANIVPEEW